jgi:sarcosine oxidase
MNSAIVVGLGAMGSAAAQHLAAAGYRVQGFDRHQPPHLFGSSHGRTRIVRQCYFEDPRYVPLVLRAYELWDRLATDARVNILHLIGAISVGRAEGELGTRSQQSAAQFGLAHRMLSAADLRRQYPQFRIENNTAGLWEEKAGYVIPEDCVRAQLRMAAAAGAELHFDEPVLGWSVTPGGGVIARTAQGSFTADRLVVAGGAWSSQILESLHLPLKVTRQVVFWIAPRTDADIFRAPQLPVFLHEGEPEERLLYGFPALVAGDEGVKAGLHGSEQVVKPDSVERDILASDEGAMRSRIERSMPSLWGRRMDAETCLYTMTPDEHFIVDRHPEFPQVALAAGFSGHGFKFASAVGEILAQLTAGEPSLDISLFALSRF